MHVDVKIPGLEILVLLIGELRSGGHRPDIARNGLRNGDRERLAPERGTKVAEDVTDSSSVTSFLRTP